MLKKKASSRGITLPYKGIARGNMHSLYLHKSATESESSEYHQIMDAADEVMKGQEGDLFFRSIESAKAMKERLNTYLGKDDFEVVLVYHATSEEKDPRLNDLDLSHSLLHEIVAETEEEASHSPLAQTFMGWDIGNDLQESLLADFILLSDILITEPPDIVEFGTWIKDQLNEHFLFPDSNSAISTLIRARNLLKAGYRFPGYSFSAYSEPVMVFSLTE